MRFAVTVLRVRVSLASPKIATRPQTRAESAAVGVDPPAGGALVLGYANPSTKTESHEFSPSALRYAWRRLNVLKTVASLDNRRFDSVNHPLFSHVVV